MILSETLWKHLAEIDEETSGCKIHSPSGLRQRLFTVLAHAHITVLIREHEEKHICTMTSRNGNPIR